MNAITVIASVSVATGLTVVADLLKGEQSFDPVIGGFITGTMLLVLSMFSVELAAGLALILLLTSVLMNASSILSSIKS